MSPEERRSSKNGIWMCRDHGAAVDSKDPEFTVERLLEWKRRAEEESWRRVLRNDAPRGPRASAGGQLADRLRAAAERDLDVFRRTAKWPSTSVGLTLKVDALGEPATTKTLGSALISLDDLILVAPPGTGKTTTLFQIAEGVLAKGSGTPLVVPLGDWATEGVPVLDSILKRPAFRGISEDDFRAVAAYPGVALLLDGWNELDANARARGRVQIETLKAELPELGIVVSTRKQALDVPFVGTRVDLLPLSGAQQMKIAIAVRGDAGVRIVDQAWRTAGVRQLVTVPLYLIALLSLPEHAPFPTTKEDVIRRFITAHENDARRADALRTGAHGFQQDYLEGLAVLASTTANTTVADSNARRCISDTANTLIETGQIAVKPQPDSVLDALVSNHVLMRAGDASGYSFQHQQFQEWYASHSVERRIIAAADNPTARKALQAEVFNLPAWEEAILFAVERLANGDADQRATSGQGILAAFEVDPILAAEMIFHSTEKVWSLVAGEVQARVTRWHAPGYADRAVRFMLTSGRREFRDVVWPLITSENQQISLRALRNCSQFRPSVLGHNAEKNLKALSSRVRTVVLQEMVSQGGMDALDLATAIAKDDPAPDVQASVVDALVAEGADRHAVEVLQNAGDNTIDLVARGNLVIDVTNRHVSDRLAAARKRQMAQGMPANDRLRAIVYAPDARDRSVELGKLIGTLELDQWQDAERHLIYEAQKRYPRAVAYGLLTRVRDGRSLFYGADDILASARYSLDDDGFFELALAKLAERDYRAEAAASVLGPQAVGRMLDIMLDLGARLRVNGEYDRAASDRYHSLEERVAHTPGASLVAAVRARSADADNDRMVRLAKLVSRHPTEDRDCGRPFDSEALATIQSLAEEWGSRMLSSDAKRWQTASIATLASHAPSVKLLPLLKRLLDDNLRRYRAFREDAKAAHWRHGEALDEARTPHTHEYQRAFLAINAPETAALMREYLTDEQFGSLAAQVLATHWRSANEPPKARLFFGGVDFSCVEANRHERAADPLATSAEAEAIFGAIDDLLTDEATDDQKRLAVDLGAVASGLPHGRRDATIQRLMAIAPRRSRATLVLALVLSGHIVTFKAVEQGLSEVMEAGQKEPWILSDGWEVREWLRLLPFTTCPARALALVQSLPAAQRSIDRLEELTRAFSFAPGDEAEDGLFAFAAAYPALYGNYWWRDAVLRRGTLSAARRFVDCALNGTFDGWRAEIIHQLAGLIDAHFPLRAHVYDRLKDGRSGAGLALLAAAVAETPDAEGLLLLLRNGRRSLISRQTIERTVTKYVAAGWRGGFTIVPISVVAMRRELLAMTKDGSNSDAAARCLNEIDRIRDDYGSPEDEPRHPDLASGWPWPFMTPDPDAEAGYL